MSFRKNWGAAVLALLLTASLALSQGRTQTQIRYENSPRVHQLMRAGNLYLSLPDALSLAIENNLDIEL